MKKTAMVPECVYTCQRLWTRIRCGSVHSAAVYIFLHLIVSNSQREHLESYAKIC